MAAIGISPNDRFVASAGGQDDPSILIWDIDAKTPVCGKTDFSFLYILQKKYSNLSLFKVVTSVCKSRKSWTRQDF